MVAMSEETGKIVEQEMTELNKDDRAFRTYLQESLSPESETYIKSHGTIINWRKHGKLPPTDFLEDLLSVYPSSDRRFRIALRLLAAKSPHVWGADGVVWKLKALKLSKAE
jgi:hypothetical protein